MSDLVLSGLRTILFKTNSETPQEALSKGSSFSFGSIAPGATSPSLIIALEVPNVNQIGDVQLGLTNIGSITFKNSIFGIQNSATFDNTLQPTEYFQGVNTNADINSPYNISIGTKDSNTSNYVYLSLNLPSNSDIVTEAIRFQWFFKYD